MQDLDHERQQAALRAAERAELAMLARQIDGALADLEELYLGLEAHACASGRAASVRTALRHALWRHAPGLARKLGAPKVLTGVRGGMVDLIGLETRSDAVQESD